MDGLSGGFDEFTPTLLTMGLPPGRTSIHNSFGRNGTGDFDGKLWRACCVGGFFVATVHDTQRIRYAGYQ
jgi:hypothetical protein